MTESVVDLILTRLLAERDRLNRVEAANGVLRRVLFAARDLTDAPDDDGLLGTLAELRAELDRLRAESASTAALELGEVRSAVEGALTALGIAPSGNLRLDAENLRRLVVTMRAPMAGLL